ncbi:hypothetical protein BVC80_1837g98 [Macleaya cordata]|uniref:Uncharacterized protein n=1 Tax=Macleaya cordata TaxID=56857 RepID=A0A200R3Q0_MACCD|nr:hypothetical protein BVC80_1837g98 [Macleaya cordata]
MIIMEVIAHMMIHSWLAVAALALWFPLLYSEELEDAPLLFVTLSYSVLGWMIIDIPNTTTSISADPPFPKSYYGYLIYLWGLC